jgi:phosphoribosylaminoimidazole carboxylase PurE protein
MADRRTEQDSQNDAGSSSGPEVAVIMGSDSDLPVMIEACKTLEVFGIAYRADIVSAHRTPLKMVEFARGAAEAGIKVIIAGAGGAAHLPGMVASLTPLPVIGVPVRTSAFSGLDSLFSIVQMPRGVPVATVAVNNAENAALLAARILGIGTPGVRGKVRNHLENQERKVHEKAGELSQLGPAEYLKRHVKL